MAICVSRSTVQLRNAGQPGQSYGTTPGCTPPTGRRSGLPAMSTGSRLPTTSLSVRSSGGSSPWRRATDMEAALSSGHGEAVSTTVVVDTASVALVFRSFLALSLVRGPWGHAGDAWFVDLGR